MRCPRSAGFGCSKHIERQVDNRQCDRLCGGHCCGGGFLQEAMSFTNSYYNEDKAKLVVDIVKQINLAANNSSSSVQQQQQQQQRQQRWDSHLSVRIITFYQGQVSCIQRCLQRENLGQVLVATVDSSQCCKADIVIVLFVRSTFLP